jgi:agmatinase
MANPIRPTLLGIPFDAASSYQRGAAKAPKAIREFLRWDSSNTWSEDGHNMVAPGVLSDAGDLEFPAELPWTEPIERGVGAMLDRGETPLILGGDHAITFPVVKAMAAKYPKLAILHFDAHGDLYDSYEGDRLSHACPFARIMENRFASRLVQVGIRTLNDHQRDQVKRFGVEVHEMRHWNGPFTVRFEGPVYLSLDLDALDPAYATGISHPEPGGLSVRDIVTMIQRLEGQLVGADVVEFNPVNDASSRTGLVAAKFVKELVSAFYRTNR